MPEFYTTPEVGAILLVTSDKVRDWINTGKLTAIKAADTDKWLVSKRDLERFVRENYG